MGMEVGGELIVRRNRQLCLSNKEDMFILRKNSPAFNFPFHSIYMYHAFSRYFVLIPAASQALP